MGIITLYGRALYPVSSVIIHGVIRADLVNPTGDRQSLPCCSTDRDRNTDLWCPCCLRIAWLSFTTILPTLEEKVKGDVSSVCSLRFIVSGLLPSPWTCVRSSETPWQVKSTGLTKVHIPSQGRALELYISAALKEVRTVPCRLAGQSIGYVTLFWQNCLNNLR